MPSIAFPDLTAIGTQQTKRFDGSCAKVRIGTYQLPPGTVKSVAYALTVEGIEYGYALGSREAHGKTPGNIKPGEFKLTLYADKVESVAVAISASGVFLSSSVDISVIGSLDGGAGIAALAQAALGNVRSIVARGCDVSGLSGSIETGGAALSEEWTFMPDGYTFNGKTGLFTTG